MHALEELRRTPGREDAARPARLEGGVGGLQGEHGCALVTDRGAASLQVIGAADAVSHMLGVLESELDVDEHLREVAERMVRVVIRKAGANIERLAAESGAQISLGPTRRGG